MSLSAVPMHSCQRQDPYDSSEFSVSSTASFGTDTDDDGDSFEELYTWIGRWCKKKKLLCRVQESFIKGTNLAGLKHQVMYYEEALDVILDKENAIRDYSPRSEILKDAEKLYGLIHARYILTKPGLKEILSKWKAKKYNVCSADKGQAMLPIGVSDEPGKSNVRFYCPKCEKVTASSYDLDGAYFGTALPYIFFSMYPKQQPSKNSMANAFRQRIAYCAHEDCKPAEQQRSEAFWDEDF